jgi:hypothetical protein
VIGSDFTRPIQGRTARRFEGEIRRLLVEFLPTSGAPSDWRHDPRGRPTPFQLATIDRPLAPWATVIQDVCAMPRIRRARTIARGPGRPPLEMSVPRRCIAAAWLKDFGLMSYRQIENVLGFVPDQSRTHSKTVEDHVRAGRRLLRQQGILPWALWGSAAVRQVELEHWWLQEGFLNAIVRWAVSCQVGEERRTARRFLRDGLTDDHGDHQSSRAKRRGHREPSQLCPTQEVSESDWLIAAYVGVPDAVRGTDWRVGLSRDELLAEAQSLKRARLEAELSWTPPSSAGERDGRPLPARR